MKTEQDNTYKHMLIFFIIWVSIIVVVIPLIDQFIINHAFSIFLCENGFIFPTESNEKWCEIIGANIN